MRSALTRALAVGFTAAAIGAASVGTATASTTHKRHSDAVQPYGACSGDPGPFVEVAVDYGKVFHAASSYVDYNGTSGALTDTFTNSVTTTVSTTFSVNLSVSFDIIATSVKADLGLSVQQTNAITTGHTIQFAVPAHQYGHAQYGAWQEHVSLEQYNQNSNCVVYNDVYSDSYLDLGAGWNTWTSTS